MSEVADKAQLTVPGRRWLRPRYGLRTMLVVVTLAAALFGWESYVTWNEQRAAHEIEKLYGSVEFESIAPGWLRQLAGEDYLMRVAGAKIHSATTEDALPHLRAFGRLETVVVLSDTAGDAGFSKERFEAALPGIAHHLKPQWRQTWFDPTRIWPVSPAMESQIVEVLNELNLMAPPMVRSVVVQLRSGTYYCIVRAGSASPGYATSDWSALFLFDDDRLIDWKHNDNEPGNGGVETAIDDVDGDGFLDVSFQSWPIPDLSQFDPNSVPDIDPVWLEVYEIASDGFRLLMDESHEPGDE